MQEGVAWSRGETTPLVIASAALPHERAGCPAVLASTPMVRQLTESDADLAGGRRGPAQSAWAGPERSHRTALPVHPLPFDGSGSRPRRRRQIRRSQSGPSPPQRTGPPLIVQRPSPGPNRVPARQPALHARGLRPGCGTSRGCRRAGGEPSTPAGTPVPGSGSGGGAASGDGFTWGKHRRRLALPARNRSSAPRGGRGRRLSASHVETEEHDVPLAHDVVLALQPHQAPLPSGL